MTKQWELLLLQILGLLLLFNFSVTRSQFINEHNYTCIYNEEDPDAVKMLCCPELGCESPYEFIMSIFDPVGSNNFWLHLCVCIALVVIAGMMSGLTMGLMSLDLMNLKILGKSGTPKQRKYAKGIIPLVKKHHLLLVTLLLANAAAMETLPIFLEKLVPSYVAIILSVTLVLAFGEIIPQAICTRYGLAIGYYLRYVVWAIIVLTFLLSYPIGKLLDCLIGHEGLSYLRRAELSELVQQHAKGGDENNSSGDENQGPLNEDEVRIIRGALSMREKTCGESVYTPLNKVFSLELRTTLDRAILKRISDSRHSRIPIYRKHPSHIVGLLLTKSLIHISPEDNVKISTLELTLLPRVTTETPLYTLLNQFQKGKSHMALVLDPSDNLSVKGVVTLEDVIEQLLESEIFDEADLERRNKRRLDRTFSEAPIMLEKIANPSENADETKNLVLTK